MSIEPNTFSTISPSRYITFTIPNPFQNPNKPNPPLQVSVLDSPLTQPIKNNTTDQTQTQTQVAALIVPTHRHHDWLFSTFSGHLHLLLSLSLSRLILIFNSHIDNTDTETDTDTDTNADTNTSTNTNTNTIININTNTNNNTNNIVALCPDNTNATEVSLPSNCTKATKLSSTDDANNITLSCSFDDSSSYHRFRLEHLLQPLLLALSPMSSFSSSSDLPTVPFLVYDDEVLHTVPLEVCKGSIVGEFLVEDVEIDAGTIREFRRRMRFRRMPNLVQTQVRIASSGVLDLGVLVQPYLAPMVASLALVGLYLEECVVSADQRPRALCIGIGGGALVSFLREKFGFFDILGVEIDDVVLGVAKKYFGFVEDEFLRVCVGDGIELIASFARGDVHWGSVPPLFGNSRNGDNVETEDSSNNSEVIEFESIENSEAIDNSEEDTENGGDYRIVNEKFNVSSNSVCDSLEAICSTNVDDRDYLVDVILFDLDSSDVVNGPSAPPLEFVQKSVLLAVRSVLHERGVFAMNVIPRSDSFYAGLVDKFREVFSELYEIDVGNGENYVLIATASPVGFDFRESTNIILEKLKGVIDSNFIDRMRKI